MSDETPLVMPLSAQGVSRTYSESANTLTVLHEVDFILNPGECVAVVGSSGSGKSTLLNILGGLDHPSTGEVWVAGQSLQGLDENKRARIRNQHLGFVYQFHHLLPEFTALENVAMPLLLGKDDIGSIEQRAADMLIKVGLGSRLKHKPGQLSGGERQRVAIARALVSNPQTVLMDEPTGNLDQTTAEAIQGLILELNESIGIAFVVVTHDLHLAQKMDRMLTLDAGHLKKID